MRINILLPNAFLNIAIITHLFTIKLLTRYITGEVKCFVCCVTDDDGDDDGAGGGAAAAPAAADDDGGAGDGNADDDVTMMKTIKL